MKRIEAIIPVEKVSELNAALKGVCGGSTIVEAKGRGKGEKPMVEYGRGTSRFRSEFSVRASFTTVVDDSKVDDVIKQILDCVSTGSAGDGKIFVSDVIDAIDIGSHKRGEEAVM
jgi:nitrogen regulatory protein P-II 1